MNDSCDFIQDRQRETERGRGRAREGEKNDLLIYAVT